MEDPATRRSAGRPRKHANATERNAAWRTRCRLVKITLEVPEDKAEEIRRIARQFRSVDTYLKGDAFTYYGSVAENLWSRRVEIFDLRGEPVPRCSASMLDGLKYLFEVSLATDQQYEFQTWCSDMGLRLQTLWRRP